MRKLLGLLMSATVMACGGKTVSEQPSAEAGAPPPMTLDCLKTVLTASPAMQVMTYSAVDPTVGLVVAPQASIAATPRGDRVLVAYGQGSSGNAAVVQLGASTVTVTPPVSLTAGRAAFDGQEFAAVSQTSGGGLSVQRITLDGSLDGSPVTVVGSGTPQGGLRGFADPVSVPGGVAAMWQAPDSTTGTYILHASLIGPGPTLVADTIVAGDIGRVGLWNGRAFAWSCEASQPGILTDLGWPDGTPATYSIGSPGCPLTVPDTLAAFDVRPWGPIAAGSAMGLTLSENDGGYADLWLFEGTPGQSFTPTVPVSNYVGEVASDACGRVVQLATTGNVPVEQGGGIASFYAQGLEPASSPLTLDTGVWASAIAPTPAGFVVVWFDQPPNVSGPAGPPAPLPIKLATLAWR